ncbi:MAG: acetyl-CoA carboxylase carboxyltransferase subunit alpha [Candidatus Marinimicrobia bacterium]|nr:acetyl-CoA carboxylase carboxyltransferase subunit alpha [Candidatus Neomarinimicrobiota bacterium]
MTKYILEFEKPLRDLEKQIEATKLSALERGFDMSREIAGLEKKLESASIDFYKNLSRWQRVQMARHPERPYTLDYIDRITSSWLELHGDRHFADDPAIVGGLATIDDVHIMLIGQQKGRGTRDNLKRRFGMPNPEGYRKAHRLMKLAAKFNIPVVTFIDTQGAYPGIGAEERGQAEAIAQNLITMSMLPVPILSLVIGEGASGGALGIGLCDRMLMLENTWFSVISPEGSASILYRDASMAKEAADAMKVAPNDLVEMGLCDRILPEPTGGAHRDVDTMAKTVKAAVLDTLAELTPLTPEDLVAARIKRYENIGQWTE